MTDLFGSRGRAWLAAQHLPPDEHQSIEASLRQLDFVDGELRLIDASIAEQALGCPAVRRLVTVPGVHATTAATFMAVVGDIRRFPTPRHLVGYLGLDPRVRQSGSTPARHGAISKQGSSHPRHVLVETAWTVLRTPGPLRAFGQRIQARRGSNIAAVAVARKMAVLFWHLLTSEQDYAFGRPSLTREKIRRIGCCTTEGRAPAPATKPRCGTT